jgi:hypothetical protein
VALHGAFEQGGNRAFPQFDGQRSEIFRLFDEFRIGRDGHGGLGGILRGGQ